VTAYRAWLFTTLAGQLLISGEPDPDAVSGLSFAGLVLGG
jgi:TetR/AcrR family transcriptional regulator of autoinduction and epiphytic fitness